MMSSAGEEAVLNFLSCAKEEFAQFAGQLSADTYRDACRIILQVRRRGGRVHVTGIGKPGHLAGYIASLLSSTGTPAYFLHGTEAVHGSCGQLEEGDVVICISNSGETAELKATALAIRENGGKIIAVTGNPDSWLAKFGDAHLFAGVAKEGGPLNRAPRISVLAEMLTLQALSAALQGELGLTPRDYVRRHPGGSLGALRKGEKETC